MFENQDIENESPFSEDIEKNDFNSEEVTPFQKLTEKLKLVIYVHIVGNY